MHGVTHDAAISCGPPPGPTIAAGIGTGGTGWRAIPNYVLGHAADTARSVEVRFDTGQTLRVPTVAVPAFLGPVRFFAAPLPKGVVRPAGDVPWFPIVRLAGYDARGEVVACSDPSQAPGTLPLADCR